MFEKQKENLGGDSANYLLINSRGPIGLPGVVLCSFLLLLKKMLLVLGYMDEGDF